MEPTYFAILTALEAQLDAATAAVAAQTRYIAEQINGGRYISAMTDELKIRRAFRDGIATAVRTVREA